MASNLLNPIQLLRGTSAAIAAAQGKEGTLYYDTDRDVLVTRGASSTNIVVRSYEENAKSPTIYVDAVNGNDNNSGFTEDSPLKTFEHAMFLTTVRYGIRRPNIKLYPGDYYYDNATGVSFDRSIDIQAIGDTKPNLYMNATSVYVAYPSFSGINIHLLGRLSIHNSYVRVSKSNIYVDYTESVGGVLYCSRNSVLETDTIIIDGTNKNTYMLMRADFNSAIILSNATIQNVNAQGSVVWSERGSIIYTSTDITDGGNVTGKRYTIGAGGTISVGGRGENAIPGTIAGTKVSIDTYYY